MSAAKYVLGLLAASVIVGGVYTVFNADQVIGQRVDPAHVALLVNLYGGEDARGAKGARLVDGGRVRFNGWTQQMFEYPTYQKGTKFTAEDGRAIKFSVGGTPVEFDAESAYAYKITPVDGDPNFTEIHRSFARYRVAPEIFNETIYAAGIRNAATKAAVGKTVGEIILNPPQFFAQVMDILKADFPELDISYVQNRGAFRVPESVQKSVDAATTAKQAAETAKANKERIEAEALAETAKAQGEAAAEVARATGKAAANKLEAESLTPALVQIRQIEVNQQIESARIAKWNGVYGTTVQTPVVQNAAPIPVSAPAQ